MSVFSLVIGFDEKKEYKKESVVNIRAKPKLKTGRYKIIYHKDKHGWSQANLAQKSGVSRVMIGKYEREEAVPSIDAAKKIADAFQVSLDHLVVLNGFDKKTLQRLQDLEQLEDDKKKTLLDLIDTYIRDAKGRRTYHRK